MGERISSILAGGFFGLFGLALIYVAVFGSESAVFIPCGLVSIGIAVGIIRASLQGAPAAGGPPVDIFEMPKLTQAIGSQLIREAPPGWTNFKFTVAPDPQGGYLCCIYGPNKQSFQPSQAAQMLIAQFAARTKRTGRFTSTATKQANGEWSVSVVPE